MRRNTVEFLAESSNNFIAHLQLEPKNTWTDNDCELIDIIKDVSIFSPSACYTRPH